jgi:hypothetical protein
MKFIFMDRNRFIITGGRLLLLAGIFASIFWLIFKNRVTTDCKVSAACKNCSRFSECELIQEKEAEYGKE